MSKLSELGNTLNGKTIPNNKGIYPAFGGNGIIDYVNDFNYPEGIIVIGRVGANCGSVNYSKTKCWITDNALAFVPKENIDSYFTYCLLKYINLNKFHIGSSQPLITQSIINNLDVEYPKNYAKQKKIGEIIKIIDSKISNNIKINTELESFAKTIYDYWFLQFEFPSEVGKPYKSSGGKMVWNEELKREIPEGWNVKKIEELFKVELGGTPKRENKLFWKNGNVNWLNSGEISNFPIIDSQEKITIEGLNNSSTILMPKGTVVVSITGNIRVSLLGIDSCANQSVIGIYENDLFKKEYIYMFMNDMINRYLQLSIGNCQQHINKTEILNTLVIVPDNKTLKKYYEITSSIFDSILNNSLFNKELFTLRDFLLPLLMNGQITFKDDKY